MSELTTYFEALGLRDLVILMREIKKAPLGYDYSKRTKADLLSDAIMMGDMYAKAHYPSRGYAQAIKDFQKMLEDQRRGGEGGSPGHGDGKDTRPGSGGSQSSGKGDGKPIEIEADGMGKGAIAKAANDAANEALKRAKESARDMVKESEKRADDKYITKSEAQDLISETAEQEVSKQLEEQNRVFRVEVKVPDMPVIETSDGVHHIKFKETLAAVSAGLNVLLVGPAGSGKTFMAQQVAEALGMEFRFTGAVASEYKLLGFIDAQGRTVSTEYRKAYEHGGVFLWDEMDASSPQALLAFNAGLANGHQDFPDSVIKAHPKFRAIASANTYGNGADRVYVGRNQLDAASLDRFYMITMDYDEALEAALYGKGEWAQYVWKARKAVAKLRLRHVVSMRAIDQGLRMLAIDGMKREDVEKAVLWKSLDAMDVTKVREAMKGN